MSAASAAELLSNKNGGAPFFRSRYLQIVVELFPIISYVGKFVTSKWMTHSLEQITGFCKLNLSKFDY